MAKRVEYIDIAKGIGILLVYIGHSFLNQNGGLFQSIYSFHMPLFFMIRGMLFRYNPELGLRKTIYGKAVTLLLPYLLFSVLYYLCFIAMGSNPIGYVLDGWGRIPLWFIPILFAIEIMHLLLLNGKIILRAVVVAVFVALFAYKVSTNDWLPYCVSEIPWFYICFVSGYLLNKLTPSTWTVFHCKDRSNPSGLKMLAWGGVMYVIGEILLFNVVLQYNSNYRLQDNDLLSYVMRYSLGMIGSISMLLIASGLSSSIIGNMFKWLGANSLVILCVHWLPLHTIYPRVIAPINHVLIWAIIIVSIFAYNRFVSPQITKIKMKVYDS